MAEKTKTYTAFDYADIVDYLNKKWDIPNVKHLNGEAAAAQVRRLVGSCVWGCICGPLCVRSEWLASRVCVCVCVMS